MYQGRNFQETGGSPFPSGYSGRRIRRGGNQPTEQQEIQAATNNRPALEPTIPLHERRADNQQNSASSNVHDEFPGQTYSTNIQTTNDPTANLIRSIERKGGKHLIGVFGLNSDVVIRNALSSMRRSEFFILQKSRLISNPFSMFASAILNFMDEDPYNTRLGDDRATSNQIYRILDGVDSCNNEYEYEASLVKLQRISQRLDRGKQCREVTRILKQNVSRRDVRFIWNIEVEPRELDYNLLNDLSKIACEDMIIILNVNVPLEFLTRNIGARFDDGSSTPMGSQILSKFIDFGDIIRAN